MRIAIDPAEKTASLEVPRGFYSREGIEIAAQIFGTRADIYLEESGKAYGLTLKSKRQTAAEADLDRLAGEFVNELLNQEYRFVVGKFNHKISSLIVTQALFSARGGEETAKIPPEEQTPEFMASVEQLMKSTADEIARTMPKKLPPQGNPLPPAQEDLGA
jgi:His-Xaa-Ser system protein HxsD